MPNRILRDGILTSERIALLGWAEEVFYRRLHSVVDDHGRFHAHHALIRAACYPLLLEKVSDSDVGKWLTACVNAALVRVYPASDGKRYLEVLDFGQRIQSRSKFPDPVRSASTVIHREPPEDTAGHRGPRESTALVGVVVGVVGEGVTPPRKRGTRPQKTPLPEGFGISERVKAWAAGKGYDQLEAHLEAFVGKARKQGYAYADWDEALMEAIREDWAKLRITGPAKPKPRRAL